jgi:hypothetical protein
MASAMKIEPPPAPPPTFELTLTVEEAKVLFDLLGSIVGGGPTREIADAIWEAMAAAGVDDDGVKRFETVKIVPGC